MSDVRWLTAIDFTTSYLITCLTFMALIGGNLGYRILKWIHPQDRSHKTSGEPYKCSMQKLHVHFGESVFQRIQGKTVIDFGCGKGGEAVAYAQNGAKEVIGIEIQERYREMAEQLAREAGVAERCIFVAETDKKADIVISLDSFEHFDSPETILKIMYDMLSEGGEIWISFGLSWYHPYGGHLFSVFPWAHLIFTEEALIRWRSDFKTDGATRFSEVAGGLNQMTIGLFERLVEQSGMVFDEQTLAPISAFRFFHCRPTREFTTSLMFARLKKKAVAVEADGQQERVEAASPMVHAV